jgi:ankyrin repeat protein
MTRIAHPHILLSALPAPVAAATQQTTKRKRKKDDCFERTQRSRLNPPPRILPRTLDTAAALLKKGDFELLAKKLRLQSWLLNAVVDQKTGNTLWHLERDKPQVIATLLQALNDAKNTTRPFDIPNSFDETPLRRLLFDLNPKPATSCAIIALLQAGSTGHQGVSWALPIAYAYSRKFVPALVANIIKNGEVHNVNASGQTALSFAVQYRDVPSADALLKAGAKSDHLVGNTDWEINQPPYVSILDLLVAHYERHTTLPRPALPVSALRKSIAADDRAYALRLSRFPQKPRVADALIDCAQKTHFSEVTENLIGGLDAATLLPVLEDVIEHGHVSLVKRLLPKLPHVDTFLSSDTSLACAFKYGQKEIAVLLLGRGATGRLHPKINTAFLAAYRHGHRDLLPKLVRNICALPELHTENAAELWAAIDYGDHRTLRKLLHEFGTERTNEYYRSGLFQKIINSNQRACLAEVLNYEAENGYHLRDLPGVSGDHPIDFALETERFDMALVLAKHGARGKKLESTLEVSIKANNSNIGVALLKEILDKPSRWQLLTVAEILIKIPSLSHLLKDTLDAAIKARNLEAVEILLSHPIIANVINNPDSKGVTPLEHAISDPGMALMLVKAGAVANSKVINLFREKRFSDNYLNIAAGLISQCKTDLRHVSPLLFWAVECLHPQQFEVLLKCLAAPVSEVRNMFNLPDEKGFTALQFVMAHRQNEMGLMLATAGASTDPYSTVLCEMAFMRGELETALSIAQRSYEGVVGWSVRQGNTKLIEILALGMGLPQELCTALMIATSAPDDPIAQNQPYLWATTPDTKNAEITKLQRLIRSTPVVASRVITALQGVAIDNFKQPLLTQPMSRSECAKLIAILRSEYPRAPQWVIWEKLEFLVRRADPKIREALWVALMSESLDLWGSEPAKPAKSLACDVCYDDTEPDEFGLYDEKSAKGICCGCIATTIAMSKFPDREPDPLDHNRKLTLSQVQRSLKTANKPDSKYQALFKATQTRYIKAALVNSPNFIACKTCSGGTFVEKIDPENEVFRVCAVCPQRLFSDDKLELAIMLLKGARPRDDEKTPIWARDPENGMMRRNPRCGSAITRPDGCNGVLCKCADCKEASPTGIGLEFDWNYGVPRDKRATLRHTFDNLSRQEHGSEWDGTKWDNDTSEWDNSELLNIAKEEYKRRLKLAKENFEAERADRETR